MNKQDTSRDDLLNRHDRMAKLSGNKYLTHKRSNPIAVIATGFMAVAIIACIFGLVSTYRQHKIVVLQNTCVMCHNYKMSMSAYFRRSGSRNPEEMANAVLRTKSPRLLAAVSVVESDGNPRIKHTGYKKRHHGAFQINQTFWGKVPEDAAGQALLAEAILEELTETMSIKKALNYYGGDKTKNQYANNILAEMEEVP